MLSKIEVSVFTTHRTIIWQEWPLKESDKLILLIRDYKECIPRHLYTEKIVSAEMVTKMFGREFGIRDRASQYFENIVLYDVCPIPKYLIYYEDIMKDGKKEFMKLVESLWGHTYSQYKNKTKDLQWAKEFKESLIKYDAPALSDGKIDYHKKRIEDIKHMERIMYSTNPGIHDKYLKRYEQN
ncbi:MAG: hypothetical protein V3V72_13645 [Ignavibacteriaceae bacterium]